MYGSYELVQLWVQHAAARRANGHGTAATARIALHPLNTKESNFNTKAPHSQGAGLSEVQGSAWKQHAAGHCRQHPSPNRAVSASTRADSASNPNRDTIAPQPAHVPADSLVVGAHMHAMHAGVVGPASIRTGGLHRQHRSVAAAAPQKRPPLLPPLPPESN